MRCFRHHEVNNDDSLSELPVVKLQTKPLDTETKSLENWPIRRGNKNMQLELAREIRTWFQARENMRVPNPVDFELASEWLRK